MLTVVNEDDHQPLAPTPTRRFWRFALSGLLVAQIVLGIGLWIGVGLYLSAFAHSFGIFVVILLLSPIIAIATHAFFWMKSNNLQRYVWISICSHTLCFLALLGVSAYAALMKQAGLSLAIIAAASLLMSGCSAAASISTLGRAYELKSY